jgi:hypothetical protein
MLALVGHWDQDVSIHVGTENNQKEALETELVQAQTGL